MRHALPACLLISLGLLACTPEPLPAQVAAKGLTVRVQADRFEVRLDDAELLTGLAGADIAHASVAVRHGNATYDMKFGSFRILEPTPEPWQVATHLVDTGHGTLEVRGTQGVLATGLLEQVGPGEVAITLKATDPKHDRLSLALPCQAGEHFLGMGGQSFDVDHRGNTIPLWVQEDGIGKVATDDDEGDWFLVGRKHNTHTPMPIFLSSRNYAVVLETDQRAVFSLCSEAQDAVRLEAWDQTVKLRVFHGANVRETLGLLTARLGRPDVPADFTWAPWIDAIFGSANVRRIAHKLRDLHIPTAVVWTEDWRGGVSTGQDYTLDEDWNVDRGQYPDFEQLAQELHGLGYKFLTYENTFLTQDADVYGESTQKGYAIRKSDGTPYTFIGGKFVQASLLDLSNTEGRNWALGLWKTALQQGADGWMGDFCEWLPTDAVLADGTTGLHAHQRYPVECQKLHRDVLASMGDGVERLVFVRSAWLGSQPLVQVMWAGDQQTDFSVGDGLASVIPIGIGLGITGFPYFAHDIGGYQSANTDPTTKELWMRWCSLGALSPVMRTHHGRSANANWNWEKDAETTGHFTAMARLHMKLLPYLRAMAVEAHETGLPMLRPLALKWPEFEPGWTATDQYLLGDRIVVAPVVTQGATSRKVQLPAGTYFPLLGGPAVQGGAELTVAAPLTAIPAYVPAGTVLSLLPDGVDTAVAATPSTVTTLAQVGEDRELWLWGGGHSSLKEPGGLSYDWQADEWTGPAKTLTWNGKPVALQDGAALVTGAGKLVVDGQATLVIAGGKADRQVRVRFP
jgi:alpha-glucosidase